jgi:hypothetical protein
MSRDSISITHHLNCQLSLYLRIERHSITLSANGVTTLFANESARTL